MPLERYGVWRATATEFSVERSGEDPVSPHAHVVFEDGVSTARLSAAINVKSTSADSRLVYWLDTNFRHPLARVLAPLPRGFHRIGAPEGRTDVSLDLLRQGVVSVRRGVVVPHDVPGEANDIIDFIEPFFRRAIEARATVYIFGEEYARHDGLHDVHMNQGSDGRFRASNGVFQDGGVVVEYGDGHWEAFFIAFASQTAETNNKGQPKGQTLAQILATSWKGENVAILAVRLDPYGDDENPEEVHLINRGDERVRLGGWTIENGAGDSYTIPESAVLLELGDRLVFEVEGVPLSTKGGSITLRKGGQEVHGVKYSEDQVRRSGGLIGF